MSEISIVNHALALLAVDPIIAFGDEVKAASLSKLLYPILRDHVLEERAWTFAKGRAKLLPDVVAPAWGYTKRFLIPTETLRVLNVWENPPEPGQEENTPPVQWDREGQYILANVDVIYVSYTTSIKDTSLFSSSFRDCLAYRLAGDMCMGLTENRSLMVDMQTLYSDKLIKAGSTDGAQGRREKKFRGNLVLDR